MTTGIHPGVLSAAAGGAAYETDAVTFDGSNDSVFNASDILTDSKTFMMSCWFKRDGTGQESLFGTYSGGTFGMYVYFQSNNRIRVFLQGTGGASDAGGTYQGDTVITDNDWHHVIVSWDNSISRRQIYLDGAAETLTQNGWAQTNANNGYHPPEVGDNSTYGKFDGDMADFWLTVGESVDLSVAANLEAFRSSDGKPVDLGSDGSDATGTQPDIFLKVTPGDAASTFANNLGSGSNFTVQGSLDLASTSPSD